MKIFYAIIFLIIGFLMGMVIYAEFFQIETSSVEITQAPPNYRVKLRIKDNTLTIERIEEINPRDNLIMQEFESNCY